MVYLRPGVRSAMGVPCHVEESCPASRGAPLIVWCNDAGWLWLAFVTRCSTGTYW